MDLWHVKLAVFYGSLFHRFLPGLVLSVLLDALGNGSEELGVVLRVVQACLQVLALFLSLRHRLGPRAHVLGNGGDFQDAHATQENPCCCASATPAMSSPCSRACCRIFLRKAWHSSPARSVLWSTLRARLVVNLLLKAFGGQLEDNDCQLLLKDRAEEGGTVDRRRCQVESHCGAAQELAAIWV